MDPFGAAALLPLQLQAQPTQQGTGTADHLTLLRLLLFRRFLAFWAHCSCPNALVAFSITAPAHPHTTGLCIQPYFFQWSPLSSIKVPDRHIDRLIPLYSFVFLLRMKQARLATMSPNCVSAYIWRQTCDICVETDEQTDRLNNKVEKEAQVCQSFPWV